MTSQTTINSCMHDQMLESNRDDVKLEAMRCVTVMTAKGRLSVPRTLFPHIVKNVSSKNPELKKLIYLYLTNFADQEPDLALLPVATLQKSLKSPNPLVRSSALKVLTSMRLNILSAILMATLRNSVNDLSPYVRKAVAHSIIKIYRLDSSLRGELIEYIERLFNDKNSMVLSSAVASFEIVCPHKLDLVHKQYKRFCFILADCNEWGQTIMLKLLMRYILKSHKNKDGTNVSDHRILLRSAKPLLHSNNSAVVMAVVKLYIAIANHNEVRSTITRPLIRLLYAHREIQTIVLNTIEELTTLTPAMASKANLDEEDEEEEGENKSEDKNEEEERVEDLKVAYEEIIEEKAESEKVEGEEARNGKPGYEKFGYEMIDDEKVEDEEVAVKNEEVKNGETNCENLEGEDDDEDDEDANDDEDDEDDESDEVDEEEEEEDEEEDEDEEEEDEVDEVENEGETNDKKDDSLDKIPDISNNTDPSAYREVFRPYIKSFFVKSSDNTQTRLAKLRILTNLSSSMNVSQVLRELQAYISTYVEDKEFVSGAIHAIGRCAVIVKEVAHTCLNGLTMLLSNNNEHIVSEAIVVLRSQIINKNQPDQESNNEEDDKIVSTVIKQVTKLLPKVTAPQARATILWILAEFCDKNPTAAKCAPNVLRSIAKSFCQEDNFVKLQSLTLASKFLLSLDKEKKADLYCKVQLLTGYLFSLAKYDINHDVRDRGRFLKKLLDDEEICSKVLTGVKKNQPIELEVQTAY